MGYHAVHPSDLRGCWATVLDGLKQMPAEDWIPEDVYHAIRSGQATLFVFEEAGDYAGFVVLERVVERFSGTVSCHVWLAYNAKGQDTYDAAVSLYRDAAKQMGASRITFSSPRPGWAKRYRLLSATYEIPLE